MERVEELLEQYGKEFEKKMELLPPGIFGAGQNAFNSFISRKVAELEVRVEEMEEANDDA